MNPEWHFTDWMKFSKNGGPVDKQAIVLQAVNSILEKRSDARPCLNPVFTARIVQEELFPKLIGGHSKSSGISTAIQGLKRKGFIENAPGYNAGHYRITKSGPQKNDPGQYLKRCKEVGLYIQEIVHIPSVLGVEYELIGDFSAIGNLISFIRSYSNHHESIRVLIPPESTRHGFKSSDYEECIRNHWISNNLLGFAVLAIVPGAAKEDDEAEVSWLEWIYADTFDKVFDLAVEWAEKQSCPAIC